MKKIMVIDDNPDFIKMITEYLSDINCSLYTVSEFSDERDIVKKIEEVLPDLILLDINLGRVYGLKVIECIKRESKINKIPLIIITASDYNDIVKRIVERESNVLGFYSKLELDIIKGKINSLFKG
jgi:CheY-like chemotaxis protein